MAGPGIVHDAMDQWVILQVGYACYASLSFVTWEWLITLSFEANIIWRKETPRYTKLLYVAPRYLGLIFLICNAVAMSRINEIYIVKQETCRWWYGFQLLASDIMLLLLEILLLIRIFALYDRRKPIAVFLSVMLGLKTIAVITLSVFAVCRTTFSDACLVDRAHIVIVYISLLEMVVQTLIWGSTLYKHLRTCWAVGWQNIPLLSLVTRDGTFTFALFLALYVLSLTDAINGVRRIPAKSSDVTTLAFHNILFPIITAITSFSSCRLIMNMQTFTPREIEEDEYENDIQLTTLPRA